VLHDNATHGVSSGEESRPSYLPLKKERQK